MADEYSMKKHLGNALVTAAVFTVIAGPLVVLLEPAFRATSVYRAISFLIVTSAVGLLLLIQGLAHAGAHHAKRLMEDTFFWSVFLAVLVINLLFSIIACYA